MLNAEDNALLTRVGPNTPMGEYLRRYWVPALLSEEVPSPDCPPSRVRILGETLIAFRDTDGNVGLLDNNCPHRRASLFFGRNEERGLRCVYHGWKYDVNGNCVDMPSEPAESNFKDKVRITAYPCEERGGVVWAYMGPLDLKPELPNLAWAAVPDSNRFLSKCRQDCNWLQALEGGIDSSHISFLHSSLKPADYALNVSSRGLQTAALHDRSPRFFLDETDYGLIIGARRNTADGQHYWRVTPWMLPYATIVPAEAHAVMTGNMYVPADDNTALVFRASWHPLRPLTDQERNEYETGGVFHELVEPVTYRPYANKDNDYLQDRNMQRTVSFTGIKGIQAQDMAVIESMGSTVDRTREHLGTSDSAILGARRRLLREVANFQEGIDPPAAQGGDLYWVRSAAVEVPTSMSLREVAECSMSVEESTLSKAPAK